MRKTKKIIGMVIISSLILSMFTGISPVFTNNFSIGDIETYEGIGSAKRFRGSLSWEEYKMQEGLSNFLPERSDNKLLFNYEVWQDIQLIVYGDWSDVPGNMFKPGTQPIAAEPIIPNTGYYISNGKRGMHRYSGYDQTGTNKVTTPTFVADVAGTNTVQSKNWIWRSFTEEQKSYFNNSGTFTTGPSYWDFTISNPNHIALYGIDKGKDKKNDTTIQYSASDIQAIKNWMANTLSDPIQKGTITGHDVATDLNVYNYINVETEPTSRFTGKGRAYHIGSDNSLYYYNLKINPIEEKKIAISDDDITAKFYNVDSTLTDNNYKIKGDFGGSLLLMKLNTQIEESIYYSKADIVGVRSIVTESIGGEEFANYTTNNLFLAQSPLDLIEESTFFYPILARNIDVLIAGSSSDFYFDYDKETIDSFTGPDGIVNIEVDLHGEITYVMVDGKEFSAQALASVSADGQVEEFSRPTPPDPLPQSIDVQFDAPKEMLDIDNFDIEITENNLDNLDYIEVTVEGEALTGQEKTDFINGNYKFPVIEKTKLYDYEVIYHQKDDLQPLFLKSFVNVYDHRPMAYSRYSGTYKENRKFDVNLNFETPEYVEGRSATRITDFRLTTTDGTLYTKENSAKSLSGLMKNEGYLTLNYRVSNDFGDRSYLKKLYIQKDFRPDIIAQVWNPQMIRGESLDLHFEAVSTDGDTIDPTANNYIIRQDEDKNGVYEKILDFGSFDPANPPEFSTTELGKFSIDFSTRESWDEETIEEYVTLSDYRTHKDTVYFEVINSTPINNVDTDFDFEFPQADIMTILDPNLNEESKEDLKSQRIDFNNSIRRQGIDAISEIWDTKTYIYTRTGTAQTTTSSYPSSAYNYSDINGYSGTIPRINVVDDSYTTTETYYVYKEECKTVNVYETVWNGHICGFDEDGIGKVCKVLVDSYEECKNVKVKKTRSVHHDRWIGYYEGEVSKDVKQNWDYSVRDTSEKVIVYYTDSSISNITDLNYLKTIYPDNIVIEISPSNSGNNDLHIPYSTNEEDIYQEIAEYLKGTLPELEGITLLKGDTINLYTTSIDDENDPIVKEEYQIIHDANYYDTSDTSYTLSTGSNYLEDSYVEGVLPTSMTMDKVGKYQIYRRITDLPNGNPNYSQTSNESMLEFFVHTKPQADFYLDWTYNPSETKYELTWIDESFDPDFVNRSDKGVVDRKLKYREIGNPSWIYGEPTLLLPGDYEMEYIVRDNFGVWSDVNAITFTLDNVPPPQLIQANLEVVDNSFSLSSIPVTEDLRWADIITRYPYQEQLRIEIRDLSNNLITTYIRTNSDPTVNNLNWGNEDFGILPDYTPDNNYKAYIIVEDPSNSNNNASKLDNFTINTPVDLVVTDSIDLLSYEPVKLKVETSKYVDDVRGTIFDGTSYEDSVTFNLDGQTGTTKRWSVIYDTNETVPEGDYIINYRAETTNGNVEDINKVVEVVWLRINSVNVLPIDPMRGDNIIVELDTSGGADIARILLDSEMQSREERSELATHLNGSKNYQPADGNYYYNLDRDINDKADTLEFVTGLDYGTTIADGTRKRSAYLITVQIQKDTMTKEATFELDFEGDVRQTLKINN